MLIPLITLFTMIAFAANSVLCRVALEQTAIDPLTFTLLRIAGGAGTLALIWRLRRDPENRRLGGSWISGAALLGYALAFSLAYVSLNTATGALILFGSVQATMIGAGLIAGERPGSRQWLGIGTALVGLFYLLSPGVESPDPLGALLMALSGACWGVYSMRGKGEAAPLPATAGNFIRAVALILVPAGMAASGLRPDWTGAGLAILSGSVTSGLGYVLWYRALRGLTAAGAAIVQLSVPILAAFGGVLFLSEALSQRLVIAAVLILSGIAAVVTARDSNTAIGNDPSPASASHE